ncbi:MAG: YggT family protein [Clostridia bacterium]|nr:YggT family protein [Clostridia bacterium]
MITILINSVYILSEIIIWVILARCILSWFVRDPYSPIGKIYMLTIRFTEPIVRPCRNLLGNFNTGNFDFSLLVAFLLVEVVSRLIIRLLMMLY